jgi:membrane associated rhomboid family serine protease
VFGGPVEDRLGPARYLLLYFACGVIAALTHYQFNPTSPVPALGASGAIGGVIGCYVRLLPFSLLIVVVPILSFPFFFDVPAIVFVGIWFLMQVTQGMGELLAPATGPGIAWWAQSGASSRACFWEVCLSCRSASIDLTTLTGASLVSAPWDGPSRWLDRSITCPSEISSGSFS